MAGPGSDNEARVLPPLVEPGPPLTPERLARFSRQIQLPGFGEVAQRRLANARVLVVGGGGLGSASIPYLASAGVGTIGVADDDVVEASNLHRQIVHGISDIGRDKVDSIADFVAAIDLELVVNRHRVRLDSSNIQQILAGYDLVLDGSDNFATRYLTNDAALLAGKPLVWGAILRYDGQTGVAFDKYGPNYRDLYPEPPEPGDVLSCSQAGVLPGVCAVIGAIMSAEAVKLITGVGVPLIGRVTNYNALTASFRHSDYKRIPDAAPVTELIDYAEFCGVVEESAPIGAASTETSTETSPTSIDVYRLSEILAAGEPVQLLDVREPFEWQIAHIPGAELIPLGALPRSFAQVRRDIPVVFYCHHSPRAEHAVELLRQNGYTNVASLAGGIDAYSALVDSSLARY